MDLIVWKEKGLSEVDDAEQRYQRILANEELEPFSSLEPGLKSFIEAMAEKFPSAILTPSLDQAPLDAEYSSLGLVMRFGDDAPGDAHEEVLGTATDLNLTMYDPEMGMVMGYDDSIDIEILDNE